MKISFYLLVLCLTSIVLCLFSCKKSTEPINTNKGPDTTSHDFSWTIDTFGTHSTSTLYDVSIIDKSNIWAVGEIYTDDEEPYNSVQWNGSSWKLIRIPVKIFNTNIFIPATTTSIIAFEIDNIFAYSSGEIIHYDGLNWGYWYFLYNSYNDTTFGGFNKLWGTSSNNCYGAGNKGTILHFNGQIWNHIQSGTHLNIRDIWGSYDPVNSSDEILAIASTSFSENKGRKILKITNSMVTTLPDSGLPIDLSTIWFQSDEKYYVGGSGLFYTDSIGGYWNKIEFPDYYITDIRGNGLNDFFVVGVSGLVSHYNGSTWHHYMGNSLPLIDGIYYVVRQYKEKVVIVGEWNRKAIIITGIRNN